MFDGRRRSESTVSAMPGAREHVVPGTGAAGAETTNFDVSAAPRADATAGATVMVSTTSASVSVTARRVRDENALTAGRIMPATRAPWLVGVDN